MINSSIRPSSFLFPTILRGASLDKRRVTDGRQTAEERKEGGREGRKERHKGRIWKAKGTKDG